MGYEEDHTIEPARFWVKNIVLIGFALSIIALSILASFTHFREVYEHGQRHEILIGFELGKVVLHGGEYELYSEGSEPADGKHSGPACKCGGLQL
jgi:hypothetical protein